MANLYRKEVYEHRQSRAVGSLILQPPKVGWLAVGLSAFLLICATLFLFLGHYVRHEIVSGYLVPEGGITSMPATVPGIVTRVMVHEGQRVKAGQPLAEVATPQASARWGDAGAEIEKQLLGKRSGIQEDIRLKQHLTSLQAQDAELQASSLRAQRAQITAQIGIQRARLRDSTEILEMWRRADSGVISRMQLAQQHDTVLQISAQISELSRQDLLLERSLAEVRSAQQQRLSEAGSSRIAFQKELADVDQAIFENAKEREAVIKAPADAIVGPIYASAGQSIDAGQSLLVLYPPAAPLLAELWVPPRSAGFIRIGQRVLLRYRSFPYERFGQYPGVVRSVSSTPIDPPNMRAIGAQSPADPAYRVMVALEQPYVSASATDRLFLRPGMDVDAAIQLERRTLAEWVFEPLYRLRRRWPASGHGAYQ